MHGFGVLMKNTPMVLLVGLFCLLPLSNAAIIPTSGGGSDFIMPLDVVLVGSASTGVDDAPPIIGNMTISPSDPETDELSSFEADVYDNTSTSLVSGLDTVEITIFRGTTKVHEDSMSLSIGNTWIDSASLTNSGEHTFMVTATDNEGNVAHRNLSFNVTEQPASGGGGGGGGGIVPNEFDVVPDELVFTLDNFDEENQEFVVVSMTDTNIFFDVVLIEKPDENSGVTIITTTKHPTRTNTNLFGVGLLEGENKTISYRVEARIDDLETMKEFTVEYFLLSDNTNRLHKASVFVRPVRRNIVEEVLDKEVFRFTTPESLTGGGEKREIRVSVQTIALFLLLFFALVLAVIAWRRKWFRKAYNRLFRRDML